MKISRTVLDEIGYLRERMCLLFEIFSNTQITES